MGYAAIYPEDVIAHHRAFIARRRAERPSEEYRELTTAEWDEFLAHFELRKVALGICGRDHGTPCQHENACVRCPLLRADPAQMPRLEAIHANLVDRLAEAKERGWLGEVAAIETTMAAAAQKLKPCAPRTTELSCLACPMFRPQPDDRARGEVLRRAPGTVPPTPADVTVDFGILHCVAVTQQLARIPATHLAACRQSVEALDELCCFMSAPDEDYLDLNWWPVMLERAWELTGASARALTELQRGFDSGEEVNPAYRDRPTIWEHPVTALEPPQVGEVAEALRAVTPEAVHAVVPSNPDQIEAMLGKLARDTIGDLAEQLAQQHAILRDFYAEAAHRQLAIAQWWD